MEKLDFVILYVIMMLVFGLGSTIFFPESYGFGGDDDFVDVHADDYKRHNTHQSLWDAIISTISGIINFVSMVGTFLFNMLTFGLINIVPAEVALVITVPMHIGMGYVILTVFRGGG